MKKIIILIGALFLLTACASSGDMKADVLSANVGVESMDGVQIIDVRSSDEFKSGCLSGAQNVDVQSTDFTEKISKLDKNSTYLVYCRSGRRSSQAVELMKNAGFTNVKELNGGILNWQEQGNELSQNCG